MSVEPGCPFCQILQGASEASFVYQDELVSAFMDLYPVVPGHMLVIPNDHFQDFSSVEPAAAGRMFQLGKLLGEALRRSGLRLDGISYFLAEGEASGQVVPHAHLHIIPRHAGDDCGLRLHKSAPRRAVRDTLKSQAAEIRNVLKEETLFGT